MIFIASVNCCIEQSVRMIRSLNLSGSIRRSRPEQLQQMLCVQDEKNGKPEGQGYVAELDGEIVAFMDVVFSDTGDGMIRCTI